MISNFQKISGLLIIWKVSRHGSGKESHRVGKVLAANIFARRRVDGTT